jgi:glycosyltransferase involved in cell wall biosynthesis
MTQHPDGHGLSSSAALYTYPIGVNAIASWNATTGLAEAARRSVTALLDAGVDVYLADVDYGAPTNPNRLSEPLRSLPRGRPYPIDICFLNVNEISALPDSYLRRENRPSYLIGSWYWELPALPRLIAPNARKVDEVWVASAFVQGVISGYTTAPICVFPGVVEPIRNEHLTRHDFDLPDDSCLFVFNFDAHSTWGVIEAFRAAFDQNERGKSAHLVIKAINLWSSPAGRADLISALDSVRGILIEDDLGSEEMASLISLCDVYVSLHRAEGFGLGMAEAMYFGLPVIGTSYSGNVDFMTTLNSCPISYHLEEVQFSDLIYNASFASVYEPGQVWAEPDRARASEWMRYLHQHPLERQRIGERAAISIRDRCSAKAVGAAMRAHLDDLMRTIRTTRQLAVADNTRD